MSPLALPDPLRSAVVDLGSNSVRLVVFEGRGRNPAVIFNEKAVLRLGRGLDRTGRLNEDGVDQALMVLRRYHAVVRAMQADPFDILATAAVRDATNGPEFVRQVEAALPGITVQILTGEQEAAYAAGGLICGIPNADGILADIGGGSLEVVLLQRGSVAQARTLPLGVLRLSDRAGGDPIRARAIAEESLESVPWLAEGIGRDLYLVGGAWRALARIHMEQTGYPLAIVHHYTLEREEARDLAGVIGSANRRTLERLPGVSRRRVDDMPFAAVVLRRLLRATGARRVVFSANGLREGWFMHRVAPDAQAEPGLLSAGRDVALRYGRSPGLPPLLQGWTAPLFPDEAPEAGRLREAACWMSDIGSLDHPEYRAEQAFYRVLRQPGMALDHHERAFLALTVALRYEAEPDALFLDTARMLLDFGSLRRAEILGVALRLAYTLSGGTPELLACTGLARENGQLVLKLEEGSGVFAGESVTRRLERLGEAVGLEAVCEDVRPGALPLDQAGA
jgi:exopolyphosphatase/guanosine-5'-triphosphate,3'-diphosphate pyrophosphatase